MISKELFVETLNNIKVQQEKVDRFSDALGEMCDGHPVFDLNNRYLEALLRVLMEIFQDDDDIIGWWLWEDVEKKVYREKADGSEEVIDVTEPEDFYDYLIGKK